MPGIQSCLTQPFCICFWHVRRVTHDVLITQGFLVSTFRAQFLSWHVQMSVCTPSETEISRSWISAEHLDDHIQDITVSIFTLTASYRKSSTGRYLENVLTRPQWLWIQWNVKRSLTSLLGKLYVGYKHDWKIGKNSSKDVHCKVRLLWRLEDHYFQRRMTFHNRYLIKIVKRSRGINVQFSLFLIL